MSKYILAFSIFLFFIFHSLFAQTPAFPSAQGGGMYASGGRGGKVLYVTSLSDDKTPGTLRWAIGKSGPRTILFKVSGIIDLKAELKINKGDLTIAGQTAPGDGICIKGFPVIVDADNVIVRFLRFRMGDINAVQDDAFKGNNCKNLIIDHCSMSWSTDECASFYSNENFTMQYCIVSESLRNSVHKKGTHGYGGIWGGKNASFHHNLIAHHDSRNPRFNGLRRSGLSYNSSVDEDRVDFRNNVIYNWGTHSSYGGESGKYNMVANYFKAGPATKKNVQNRITNVDMDINPDSCPPGYGKYFIESNYVFGFKDVTSDNWKGVEIDKTVKIENCKANIPFIYSVVDTQSATKAYKSVLTTAGASLMRDAVDCRVVNEVKAGTATYKGSVNGISGLIDSQNDVGGWPEYKTTVAPTDSNEDGVPDGWLEKHCAGNKANDLDKSGYTYLEIYLNSIVKPIINKQK
ncbi:MAG: pectate lyase family protein [Paludibacter sp.]